MLQSALFTYRRRVKLANGDESFNDNFINPMNVISFYWQQDESSSTRVLSVFLTNQYTVTFGEKIGEKFVNHMEDFLRLLFTQTASATYQQQHQARNAGEARPARRAIAAEVIEDELAPATSNWEG